MQFCLILFTNLALVFIMIAVHETGHYLAGLTAGIPARVMKIRLFTFRMLRTISSFRFVQVS